MNEEIEEIFDIKELFEEWKQFLSWCYENNDKTVEIHRDKLKWTMNYITNLQEENQKLKEQLNCKEYFSSTMPEDTEFVILTKNNYDRQQKDLALENIELKQENKKLRKKIKYMEMIIEYKNELRQPQDESEIHNELYRQGGSDE